MATASFTKEFSITKEETIKRLEHSLDNLKPFKIDSEDTILNMKRSEKKLLNLLRSKQ